MTVTVRFAPSPTGKLHVGNIRAALMNWLFAKREGGVFLLRMDDTDQDRSEAAYEEAIKTDLAWLGLTHDRFERQSARFADYDAAADDLKKRGLLYPCYETAEELERKRRLQRARGAPPVYDRAALDLSQADRAALEAEGRRPHWRYKLSGAPATWTDLIRGPASVDTKSVSDPVLIREDGAYLYTLPSVVDDIAFGITHIVRGEDHVTNTGVQIEIFRALGAEPPAFAHHSLLVGADGEALSKRIGSLGVERFREEGLEPMAVLSLMAKIGTSDPVEPRASAEALAADFDFAKIGRAPARFDIKELQGLNAKLLHETPFAAVADRLAAMGAGSDAGLDPEAFWLAVRGNLERISDVNLWRRVVLGPVEPAVDDAAFLDDALQLFPEGPLDTETWGAWTGAVKAKTGAKGRALFMPLRKALTGEQRGPDMAALLPLIGPERAKARLSGETA
ncbi:MAG: glutamate--tRNA ligase [Pseudomonadota bacterium]